jgi:hypothetical protein
MRAAPIGSGGPCTELPPALAGERDVHSPVGPATLEHEALVDRAVQRAAPVGVGPLREPGKQVRDEAVAIARELDDRLEHVLVSDPPKGHPESP